MVGSLQLIDAQLVSLVVLPIIKTKLQLCRFQWYQNQKNENEIVVYPWLPVTPPFLEMDYDLLPSSQLLAN